MAKAGRKRKQEDRACNDDVCTIMVDDPGELIGGDRVYPNPGQKVVALKSLRDDPLGRLHHHRQIDDAKYQAGRTMQGFYERAEIGGLKAMDTTKEPVDGGGLGPEAMKDTQFRAIKEIIRLEKSLGMEGAALTRQVLANRMFIDQIAEQRGMCDQLGKKYLGRRFRECLETLAKELHYA
jgi:hypothetical protein